MIQKKLSHTSLRIQNTAKWRQWLPSTTGPFQPKANGHTTSRGRGHANWATSKEFSLGQSQAPFTAESKSSWTKSSRFKASGTTMSTSMRGSVSRCTPTIELLTLLSKTRTKSWPYSLWSTMFSKATSRKSDLLKVKREWFSTTSFKGSNWRLLIKPCEMDWPCMSTTSKLFFPVLMTIEFPRNPKLVLLMRLYTKLNSKRTKTWTCWELKTKSFLAIFQMTTILS